jgi:hypothetical protein
MMGMPDQGRIHVEQGDTTETALEDLDSGGHGEFWLKKCETAASVNVRAARGNQVWSELVRTKGL